MPPLLKRDAPDLPVQPRSPGEGKRDWVYRQLLSAIETGVLRSGDTVPSTRTLADRWQVSRGIVGLVFEQLLQEGYIQSFAGSASRVSTVLPEAFQHAQGLAPRPQRVPVNEPPDGDQDAENSSVAPKVQAGLPFAARLPDVHALHLTRWRRAIMHAATKLDSQALADLSPQGLLPLREAICRHLAVSRGIHCHSDEVIVVTGIRHAIDLCCQALMGPDHAVAFEDPG